MKYIAYSIFACFLFFCCNKVTDASNIYTEKLHDKVLMDSLQDRALLFGDTIAYSELQSIYYISESRTSLLYCALVMSNKYNYKAASYDVYNLLWRSDSLMDDKTREMANYYLLKSK